MPIATETFTEPPRTSGGGSIRFEIYRDGTRLSAFTPVGAIVVGPESVPISGEVKFEDGLLSAQRQDEHAVGVSLMWDAGPVGAYHLETTRLQPREKPYNLNVELARFRLMRIVQKQEDWNLFDFPKAEKFSQMFRDSQALLAEALGKLHLPEEASTLADRSLDLSIDLSEQLAAFHGDLLLNRRRTAGAFVKHVVGCRVDSQIQNEKYKETLASEFDYAVLPMSWKQLQPQEGMFFTDEVDEWVEFLSKKRTPIIAGPLISLADTDVPDWMFIWEHDFDTLREELAYEYVQKVVQRYRKAVGAWNVVAGLHTNTAFTLSFEQIIELTRLLVSQVKSLLPNAKTLVTITQPFGEYHAKSATGVPPMLYAEMVAQAGINFEAFGIELEMGVPTQGRFTRDLFQLSCMLDKFSTLGRPVYLTAVSAPARYAADPSDNSRALDPAQAGRWHKPWDPQLQAEWMDAVYKLAMSKPYVESIAWGNLADLSHTVPSGGLMDDMLKPKPSFNKLQELRENFHKWHANKQPKNS